MQGIRESLVVAVTKLHGFSLEERHSSEELLAGMDPSIALPLLKEMLTSPDVERRLSVAEAMLIVNSGAALGDTLFLLRSSEAWARRYMCGLIHDYGQYPAAAELARLAKEDPEADVRGMACYALGAVDNGHHIRILEWVALNDHGPDFQGEPVCNFAIRALAELALRHVNVST